MKENIELSRNREFGDIISDTFVVIKQNFKPLLKAYFVICGLFLLAQILLSAYANISGDDVALQTFLGLIGLVFSFFNYTALILTVQSYFILYKEKGNQAPNVLEVWAYFKYYYFRVLITQILLTFALFIGMFLCFLPFIYLAIVFSMVTPIMVIENGNIEYSITKSFKIIKQNWWFTFGIILLISLIVAVTMLVLLMPGFIVYGSAQWLTGKNLDNTAGIIQAIFINLSQILWIVPLAAITLVYYTITEEKEGSSLVNRIKMFGKNNSESDQVSPDHY